jgi:hypothetical protein
VNKNHDTAMAKLADKKKELMDELKKASSGAASKLRCARRRGHGKAQG